MPSPEQLGVVGRTAAPGTIAVIDWAATRSKLDQLGAVSFQLDRVGAGYRFTCLVPASRPGQTERVEAEAATEAEAVRLALDRAGRAVAKHP